MSTYPYLVVPGGTVIALPGPSGDIAVNVSRSETVHQLIGGGTTITRRRASRKNYSLPYTSRPGVGTDDLLWAIYRGVYGDGPFIFVDPSTNNVLPLDQSIMGLRVGTDVGWESSGVPLVAFPGLSNPAVTSQVLGLFAPVATTYIMPGTSATVADITSGAPLLPNEPATFSIYMKGDSAASMTLALRSYNATTGASISLLGNTTVSVGTSWARYSYTLAATGTGGGQLLVPRVTVSSPPATGDVYFSGPQLEYASAPSLWTPGYGSPRVLVTGPPDKSIQKWGWSDLTLLLAEV